MSIPVIECRPSAETLQAIEVALAEWEAATEENGPGDEWDRRLIDSVIRDFARQGRPFSANDIRDRIPGVRKALIGRRFSQAVADGLLDHVGFTRSTLRSTRGHHVHVYAPVRQGA